MNTKNHTAWAKLLSSFKNCLAPELLKAELEVVPQHCCTFLLHADCPSQLGSACSRHGLAISCACGHEGLFGCLCASMLAECHACQMRSILLLSKLYGAAVDVTGVAGLPPAGVYDTVAVTVPAAGAAGAVKLKPHDVAAPPASCVDWQLGSSTCCTPDPRLTDTPVIVMAVVVGL